MDLHGLRAFATLAKTQNITKVAESLHLSPAAVHKQLKNLQESLDVRLYEKVGRKLLLTSAAELLLPHATDLLARYETTMSVLKDWKDVKIGTVRLGTGPATSTCILPELLAQFRAAHPDVEVLVETGTTAALIAGLAEGSLDAAIMVNPEPPMREPLRVEVVWEFTMVLVTARKDVPRRCPIADLAGLPFILMSRKGSQMEKHIAGYLADCDFQPRVTMRFDNPESAKPMLKLSGAVSILPLWAVEAEIRNGSLFVIEQEEPPLRYSFIVAVRRGGYLPPATSALIELARRTRFPWLAAS